MRRSDSRRGDCIGKPRETSCGLRALIGLFSVGAALPIVILGYISRSAMMSVRGRLLQAGRAGKVALGCAMLLIAIATISGSDRQPEVWLLEYFPTWGTNISTALLGRGCRLFRKARPRPKLD